MPVIWSSTGYEPNIVGNNSDAGMIAKSDNQSTTTERSRTSRPRFYPANMKRRWEIRIIFVFDVQHTLSEQIACWRRDAMLSIINEHASRMPLDNLSGLHATKDKLLWQGQYRKLPLVCSQELELVLSRKYLVSPEDVAASGDEVKSNSSSRGSPSKFV